MLNEAVYLGTELCSWLTIAPCIWGSADVVGEGAIWLAGGTPLDFFGRGALAFGLLAGVPTTELPSID